jgi:hypothetical protein
VPAVTETERLLRQLTANTGKPLTPVEEAFAFKRLIDESGCSQVELAKMLGRPRSVVGDRIRLVELDEAWLDLITAGKLQVSHAAILSTFSAVPSEYQKKAAAKNFVEDYRVKRFIDNGGTVPVDEMPRLLYVSFRDYIKPVELRRPATAGRRSRSRISTLIGSRSTQLTSKCGVPASTRMSASGRRSRARATADRTTWSRRPIERAMKALKAAGISVPARNAGKTAIKPAEGEAVILHENQGWARDIDPKVLLDKIDPKTITYVQNFGGDELWTSDAAAVAAAREAYRQHVEAVTAQALKSLRADLTPRRIKEYAVSGPGASNLIPRFLRIQNASSLRPMWSSRKRTRESLRCGSVRRALRRCASRRSHRSHGYQRDCHQATAQMIHSVYSRRVGVRNSAALVPAAPVGFPSSRDR